MYQFCTYSAVPASCLECYWCSIAVFDLHNFHVIDAATSTISTPFTGCAFVGHKLNSLIVIKSLSAAGGEECSRKCRDLDFCQTYAYSRLALHCMHALLYWYLYVWNDKCIFYTICWF